MLSDVAPQTHSMIYNIVYTLITAYYKVVQYSTVFIEDGLSCDLTLLRVWHDASNYIAFLHLQETMPEVEIRFPAEQMCSGSFRLLELPPDLCKLIESSVDDPRFA